jgi:hypothetical protein
VYMFTYIMSIFSCYYGQVYRHHHASYLYTLELFPGLYVHIYIYVYVYVYIYICVYMYMCIYTRRCYSLRSWLASRSRNPKVASSTPDCGATRNDL